METNSEHQSLPSLPEGSAFRQVNNLGEPAGWVRSRPNFLGLILSLFFLCAYAAALIQSFSDPNGGSVTVLSSICYIGLLVVVPLVVFIRSIGKEIALFELGFAYKTPFDFRQYRWDQVVELTENKKKSKAALKMKDGRKISLSGDYRKQERIALVDAIRRNVTLEKLPPEAGAK